MKTIKQRIEDTKLRLAKLRQMKAPAQVIWGEKLLLEKLQRLQAINNN